MDRIAIRRALVSVYDKTGLADLGRALADHGYAKRAELLHDILTGRAPLQGRAA